MATASAIARGAQAAFQGAMHAGAGGGVGGPGVPVSGATPAAIAAQVAPTLYPNASAAPGPDVQPGHPAAAAAAGNLAQYAKMSVQQIVNDPAALTALLGAVGITPQQAALGYQIAGVTNFQNNQTRSGNQTGINEGGAPGNPDSSGFNPMWNSGMDTDIHAWERILNPIREAISEGQPNYLAQLSDMWKQRTAAVPQWASQITGFGDTKYGDPWATITGSGQITGGQDVPFSMELFGSPGMNFTDPTKPLFDPNGGGPASMSQLTGFQAGEGAYYAGMSAAQLMSQIYPLYAAQFNRDPGSPAPYAGLMFGQQSYNPGASGNFIDQQGNTQPLYTEPPTRGSNPLYQEWSAFGYPGDPTYPAMYGNGMDSWAIHDNTGSWISPLTGHGFVNVDGIQNPLGKAIATGAARREYFNGGNMSDAEWQSLVIESMGRVAAAAFLGDPSILAGNGNQYETGFGMATPEDIQRYLAVAQGALTNQGSQ